MSAWLAFVVWFLVAYLVIGALVASALMQTPWSENGWLRLAAFWPLYVAALLY